IPVAWAVPRSLCWKNGAERTSLLQAGCIMSTASVKERGKAAAGKQPPDEKFWVRYSKHHELPLSSATSVMVHVLGFILIAFGAWLAWKLGWAGPEPLPGVGVVEVMGGGGGSPSGTEGGP